MDLPLRETVTKNEDDSYTIFINAKLSLEEQQEKFLHALKHISGNDFYKKNTDEIEYHAHTDKADRESAIRQKQELKNRIYSYNDKIGLRGIIRSHEHGCGTLYEAAEYLDVTEEFLYEALKYYKDKYGVCATLDNYVIYFDPSLGVFKLM